MNTTCSETLSIEVAESCLHHHQPAEAAVDLANIDPHSLQEHWQLDLLYQAHQAHGRWLQCLDVANVMSRRHPDLFQGPVLQARAFHKLGFTAEAWNILRPVATKRPSCQEKGLGLNTIPSS